MNIKTEIEKAIGFPVSVSSMPFCDYQCNAAFAIAKEKNTKPFEVAKSIVESFKSKLATAEAHKSGFINITLTDEAINKICGEVLVTGRLPLAKQDKKTVFFDYGGANIAKELHIGHLRSPIIGEAIKRTFKSFGHKTVSDPFFGDWGLQMGLVLAALSDSGVIKDGKFTKMITLDMLNEIYPAASKRSKAEPDFYKRAEDITVQLQHKKEPWYALWKTLRGISVKKIMESYDMLNCTFDTENGESDAADFIDEVIEILKKHGARESDGCLVFDIANEKDNAPMPPVILQKGNGGDLYATTDIAMLYRRCKTYKPDMFVYITDFRQELHFEQVFRVAKMGGLVPEKTKLVHISYGTMNGKDGKPFKTRSGDTIKLDEVINLVADCAQVKMTKPDKRTAQYIGVAALKFADLSNNVRKDYIFDIDKFTSFEGKTGPYLLYTIARINSILERTGLPKNTFSVTKCTRDIAVSVIKLADAYQAAAENFTLNGIVDAAYNIASKFNLLYANESIQNSPDNLAAAALVKSVLLCALDTLAIMPVERM